MSFNRFANNALWNLTGQIAPLAVALVALPPLIRALGMERFGFISLAWALVGYAGLFDLGISRAMTRLVAERLAAKDAPGAIHVGGVATTFMVLLGCLSGLLLGLLAESIVDRWLKVPVALHGEAIHALWILAASLPVVKVVTKLDPLATLAGDATDVALHAAVDASIDASCRAFGVDALDTLLLHRWAHFRAFGGRLWRHLEALQARGRVRHLGASVYGAAEAMDALRVPAVEHLQVPFNLIDTRLVAAGIEAALARRPDVTLYARSVFLQGLLVSDAELWPDVSGVYPHVLVRLLDTLADEAGFETRAQLCISYVLSHPWVQRLVVGCETQAQLRENLEFFGARMLGTGECERIRARLPKLPDALLDPSVWKFKTRGNP